MKHLLIIFSLLLTSVSWSEEIIMFCKHTIYSNDVTLKYKSGLFGKSVKRRIKGKWEKFCTFENQVLSIEDRSAVCSFPKGFTTSYSIWTEELKKRDYKTIYRGEWVFDFLKVTFDERTTWENSYQNPNEPIPSRKGFKCKLL